MPDYEKMYHIMLDAAERAIHALEHCDPEIGVRAAAHILAAGELAAEELYIAEAAD